MSKLLGDRLPDEVRRAFDGRDLEDKVGPAYLLVTSDEDETPRPCMLSAGEILAVDHERIRVALWRGSNSSRNLRRGSPALLCFVTKTTVVYMKGLPRTLGPKDDGLERFEIHVGVVETDEHEGMPITRGLEFALDGARAADVLDSWERQIASLRDG